MEWIKNKYMRGSMTLEAAIVVPIAILCILPFIYLFQMNLFQMIVERNLDDCMKEMAAEVYILERLSVIPEYDEKSKAEVEENCVEQIMALIEEYTALLEDDGWKKKLEEMGFELLGELLLEQKIKERMEEENPEKWGVFNGWNGVSFSESDFFYAEDGHHYLLKGVVKFKWDTLFSFWNPEETKVKRVYHGFVGEESGSEEEKTKENEGIVYLIGNGTRYHKSDCYLICKDTYSTTRSEAEKNGNLPCDRCDPQGETKVYKTSGGEHYHTLGCSYLYPNTTSVTLEEATQAGYSGCGICMGKDGYFS